MITTPYKWLMWAIFFIAYSGFIFYGGWKECSVREQAKQREQAIKYAEYIKTKQEEADKLTIAYEEEKRKSHVVYRTITKNIPVYISDLSDNRCIIPMGFVWLHNSAAEGKLPNPASSANDSPSGIKLSTVTDTVIGNYETCNEIRNQLIGLQSWVNGVNNH